MTVKELKELLGKFDDGMQVCLANRSRKNPQWASEIGRIEKLKLDPYLDNDYAEAQDIVVIAISGEIGEVYTD